MAALSTATYERLPTAIQAPAATRAQLSRRGCGLTSLTMPTGALWWCVETTPTAVAKSFSGRAAALLRPIIFSAMSDVVAAAAEMTNMKSELG